MAVHLLTACISVYRPVSLGDNRVANEWTHLLDTGDMSGDVFNRNGVFHRQSVALALYTRLVDENTAVGIETCGDV